MITEIQWRMKSSLNMSTYHHTLSRDDRYGIQMETITPKRGMIGTGKPNSSFFIDNDPREFATEDELIDAYNEKFKLNDETPDQEVVYVKVIRPRNPKSENV